MQNELDIVQEFANRPPVDVIGLANALGIAYVEIPMVDGSSGSIEYDGLIYKITVDENEGEQRKRFTTAHEIAHFLLHRDTLKNRKHMDRLFEAESYDANPNAPLTRTQEKEANRFAAALLMPKIAIETQIDRGVATLSELASIFRVSQEAMAYRLKNLGETRISYAHKI